MAVMREKVGPTPRGGVRSKIFFRDEEGNAADEAVATQAEVVEYDDKGSHVFRTYLEIDPRDRFPPAAKETPATRRTARTSKKYKAKRRMKPKK